MKKLTTKQWIPIVITAILMVAVMIAIFLFSGQNAESSSKVSNSVGEIVVEVLGIEVPEGQSPSSVPIFLGFNIRKIAHLTMYFLLGLTSFLFVSSLFRLKSERAVTDIVLTAVSALAISVLYAGLDEVHQLFVGGRAGTVTDVMIDSVGSFTAILLLGVIFVVVHAVKNGTRKRRVG